MLQIRDSVAVITGGSGGMGKALGAYWLEQGGRVLLADVAGDALEQARRDLAPIGGELDTVVCNVAKEDDCARLADRDMRRFGAINLVAPFAGIIRDSMRVTIDRETGKVTGKMSLEIFQAVLDVNLTGVFLTVREWLERMVDNLCKGLVCLVSSIGTRGTAGQLNYASFKVAMAVMPRVLTGEFFRSGFADRIRCVAIAPGYVGTPMVRSMDPRALGVVCDNVPIQRLIEPEEVCTLVELYRNETVAGETFYVTGGLRQGSLG